VAAPFFCPEDPLIIDAHNHPNWWGHNAHKILDNMDAQGIDKMWLFSWETLERDYDPEAYHPVLPPLGVGIPLENVLQVGREAPDRFVLGYMPDVKRPDAVDRLRAAVEIHGVRLGSELKQRVMYDDYDALRVFDACGELGLPVTIHLEHPIPTGRNYPQWSWWYGGSIDSLERMLSACTGTNFIGHAPAFWSHISGDDRGHTESYPQGKVLPGGRTVELLRTYSNLYADLSAGSGFTAISRDREFGRAFLIEQQDKLLFGRDYFDTRLMDHLLSLELPAEVFAKITYQNAQALLGDT
jgi:predicted TIM-barrel fold metal-dependent hydrolase